MNIKYTYITADSRLAPSQWETSLQSNAVSHWLGANLESALCLYLVWLKTPIFAVNVDYSQYAPCNEMFL